MKKTTRKAIRQRKICMLLIIILIIVLSILGGGYYLLSQKNDALPKNGGQNSDSRNQTDLNQNSDTVEYKGETYKYNDHLSNYLFLGIDTRETVDTYQSQADAGQADAIFLVSMDRATEKIKVLFIPRDSMTRIEVFNPAGKSLGMTTDHINIQYAYGDGRQKSCELMKTAVSNLEKEYADLQSRLEFQSKINDAIIESEDEKAFRARKGIREQIDALELLNEALSRQRALDGDEDGSLAKKIEDNNNKIIALGDELILNKLTQAKRSIDAEKKQRDEANKKAIEERKKREYKPFVVKTTT